MWEQLIGFYVSYIFFGVIKLILNWWFLNCYYFFLEWLSEIYCCYLVPLNFFGGDFNDDLMERFFNYLGIFNVFPWRRWRINEETLMKTCNENIKEVKKILNLKLNNIRKIYTTLLINDPHQKWKRKELGWTKSFDNRYFLKWFMLGKNKNNRYKIFPTIPDITQMYVSWKYMY